MRILSACAFAIGCLAATACSSSSTSGSPSSTSTQSTDSSPSEDSGASADGGACDVVVTNYDQSCAQDNDCVLAPPGGNTCDPCHAGSGDFKCDLAALNTKDSTRYANDLDSALQSIEGTSTYQQCVIASCPVGGTAKCVDSVCKLVDP